MSERIKEHKFNDERLIRAATHVIDTCTSRRPTIAEFLNYDRTHPEVKKEDGVKYYLQQDGSYKSSDGTFLKDDKV